MGGFALFLRSPSMNSANISSSLAAAISTLKIWQLIVRAYESGEKRPLATLKRAIYQSKGWEVQLALCPACAYAARVAPIYTKDIFERCSFCPLWSRKSRCIDIPEWSTFNFPCSTTEENLTASRAVVASILDQIAARYSDPL